MKELSFNYKGFKFEPIGNLLGGWSYKTECITWENKFETQFDYEDFYKVARKNHASCDVYKINDSEDMYILNGAGYFLRVYKTNTLKYCEDYEKWYLGGKLK